MKAEIDMTFGILLDSSMDPMEENRFKKKHTTRIVMLTKKSHFSMDEVEMLLLIYYKLQKDGDKIGVAKHQFRDFLHKCLDMTDDNLMDRIFLTIDKGRSQYLSMDSWVLVLSLFLKGTLEEKMHYCFTVYDVVGEGFIARDVIFGYMKNCIIAQAGEDGEDAAKDLIEILVKKMDHDRDGKISFNDYHQTVVANPQLLEAFGTCLPSKSAVDAFFKTISNKQDRE